MFGRRQSEVVHAPAVMKHLIERNMDDPGSDFSGLAVHLAKKALQIAKVEANDEIRTINNLLAGGNHSAKRRENMWAGLSRQNATAPFRGDHPPASKPTQGPTGVPGFLRPTTRTQGDIRHPAARDPR